MEHSTGEKRLKLRPNRILAGLGESIFDVLPDAVLGNLRHPGSENALLWNLIYPLAQPTLSLSDLLSLRPLWGTHSDDPPEDQLSPFYWGYSVAGKRLPGLDRALDAMDGPGPQTEVDLFLMGDRDLVLVEAKHLSGLGRCSRFLRGRCPEIHDVAKEAMGCRYWEHPDSRFASRLDVGERPTERSNSPPCSRHYQLARTLLLGARLASMHRRTLRLWMIVPEGRWRRLEKDWLDFCDRVRDGSLWRRMRVLSWEAVAAMQKRGRRGNVLHD